jgi:hypothetical protein
MSPDFLLHLFGVEKKIAGFAASRETGIEFVCIEDEALVDGGHC